MGAPNCIDHSVMFTHVQINADNVLGLGGELAKAFGSLMHSLWKGSAASVAPRSFKSQLGKFAPNFSGYNQQDSQVLPQKGHPSLCWGSYDSATERSARVNCRQRDSVSFE